MQDTLVFNKVHGIIFFGIFQGISLVSKHKPESIQYKIADKTTIT